MNSGGSRITPQILSGWKEIANYLGKGVRTVQRYEWELQLPVRRPAGKPRGSVIATREELDAWIAASPIRETHQLKPAAPFDHREYDSIKIGLAEMRRLRAQMVALRADVHESVSLLQKSLGELTQEAAEVRKTGWLPGLMYAADLENKPALALMMSEKRKAS